MALIVEDGTGLSNSESFASVATADAYHSQRGNSGWTGTDAEKEGFLRKATEYLAIRYKERWLGTRVKETQALPFPREGIVDEDNFYVSSTTVPLPVVKATCEVALRLKQGDILFADQEDPSGVLQERIKVGPIEEEIKYAGAKALVKTYPIVNALLVGLVTATNEIRRS